MSRKGLSFPCFDDCCKVCDDASRDIDIAVVSTMSPFAPFETFLGPSWWLRPFVVAVAAVGVIADAVAVEVDGGAEGLNLE